LGKCCNLMRSLKSKEPEMAEEYLRESVRVLDETHSTKETKVAQALARNDLALHLKRKGDFSAEKLYKMALSDLENSVGKKHEFFILVQHNLAELLDERGDTVKANVIRNEILSETTT